MSNEYENVYQREFGSRTLVSRSEDGQWKITCVMMESMKQTPDSEVEEVKLSVDKVGADFDETYADCMNELMTRFNSLLKENEGAGMFPKEKYSSEELGSLDSPSQVISASEV
jgi:hypothetical protein